MWLHQQRGISDAKLGLFGQCLRGFFALFFFFFLNENMFGQVVFLEEEKKKKMFTANIDSCGCM